MELLVKTIIGTSITITVTYNATVHDAKLCCATELNRPIDKWRLFYAGKELSQDQSPLSEHSITHGDTLYLLFKTYKNTQGNAKIEKMDTMHNYIYDIQSLPKVYRNLESCTNDQEADLLVIGYINRLKTQTNSPNIPQDINRLCKRFYYIDSSITIVIKYLIGGEESFDNIWPGYTIRILKKIIESYSKTKPVSYRQQKLIHGGMLLRNAKLISDYNIMDGTQIHLIISSVFNELNSDPDSTSTDSDLFNPSKLDTNENKTETTAKDQAYPLGILPEKESLFTLKIAWNGKYIKDIRQTVFQNIKKEYKGNIDFEADQLILRHSFCEELDVEKRLLEYFQIQRGDTIWILKKNAINDFETDEQKIDYFLREVESHTHTFKNKKLDVNKTRAEDILNFKIKPEHIPIIKKSKLIGDTKLLEMLVVKWGLYELKTLLTLYTHRFVDATWSDKKETLFFQYVGIKYDPILIVDEMKNIKYKFVELDVDNKEKNEFFCKYDDIICVKKRAQYKVYFRENGSNQFRLLQTEQEEVLDRCYCNYLHDHLEINDKYEIIFKFYREDTDVDIDIMEEILAATYQIKCPNDNNKGKIVVFGYLRYIQEMFFDNYNSSYFNIPKGIYLICLSMVDDHFIENNMCKFDDINDFKIPIHGHRKCIMPTFELYALPKGYDTQILIKTFPLDDKMVNIHYEFLSVIGRGGFGKVMQVRRKDNNNDKIYALKIVNKTDSIRKRQVEHSKTERKIYTQSNHPFIMKCHNIFETKAKLYFVLDFAIGGDLFFHIKLKTRFNEDITRVWCAEVALALGHLHALGVALRTIKPEDIVLDVDGHVQLTDFGLSKYLKPNTKAHTFCGTPEYLAPEVVTTNGHDKNVDWWTLGLLLYELTVGIPPFYDENVSEMYRKIREAPLIFPVLSGAVHLSNEIKDLICKLLQRDPKKRLGAVNDIDDIKKQPFFESIDWNKLYRKEISSGYKPYVMGQQDTSNFDSVFLLEPVINTPKAAPMNAENLFDPWFASNMQKLQL
eukprot:100637_1